MALYFRGTSAPPSSIPFNNNAGPPYLITCISSLFYLAEQLLFSSFCDTFRLQFARHFAKHASKDVNMIVKRAKYFKVAHALLDCVPSPPALHNVPRHLHREGGGGNGLWVHHAPCFSQLTDVNKPAPAHWLLLICRPRAPQNLPYNDKQHRRFLGTFHVCVDGDFN